MPRQARVKSGTGIYHVMLRGINRQDIFEEPEDYWRMIRALSALQSPWTESMGTGSRFSQIGVPVPLIPQIPCRIYAYCLMPNHVHILIHEQDWNIGQCAKWIADVYVRYYNKKYGRLGHLLQDRFKSEPCNDMEYFATLFRYIHQNPVKAGLVPFAKEYQYSSWGNDYFHLSPIQVCHTQTVLKRLTMEEWEGLVNEPLPATAACLDISDHPTIADQEVRDHLLRISGLRNVTALQLLSRERQKDILRDTLKAIYCGPRQLSRVSGISYNIVYNLYKSL